MAVKNKKGKRWKTGRLHWPGGGDRHEEHPDEAERLKPLEETTEFKESPQVDSDRDAGDTIRVDNKSVAMPAHLLDDEREGSAIFRLEPVVAFILLFMLAFIGFIAWQITLMPVKETSRDGSPAVRECVGETQKAG